MANFPFVIGDALQIGTATITATGNAVVLPTGTQVGSTAVATSTEVATGGGPKITNLQVIDNSFQVLDDTAVDITGGYIKITGTNFTSGCIVYIGLVPATATSFVSATEVRAQLAATAAGTYPVYLVNPDGGVAIRVPGVTFSASPSWQTASALSEQYDGAPLTLALVASDATSYTLVSGALPPGLSLNTSTGAITGTITGVTVDTVYTFTVRATDAQNQDSPRTFTVNVAVSDTYFKLTTLLLSGSAIPANTVIRDASTNNFNLTVFGDARASNFTPYGTGWSVYFDGTGDYLSLGNNNPLPATGDFTFECWIYVPSLPGVQSAIIANQNQSNRYMLWLTSTGGLTIQVGASFSRSTGNNVIAANRWYHIATTRTGTTHNLFVDGIAATLTTSGSSPASIDNTEFFIGINYNSSYAFTGYISNFRVVTSILYTSTFTPSTGSLTAITNTSLLTCHANRFLDGSTNNFTITRNGDAKIVSFNPFNITNTGVDGSMYFDGTDDYVTAGSNTNFQFGTGDFTVEWWQYISGYNGSGAKIWQYANDGNYFSGGTGSDMTSISTLNFTTAGGANVLSQTVQPYQWNHIAISRASGTTRIFVNGSQTNSLADSTNYNYAGTYAFSIGGGRNGAGTYVNSTTGYITNFKLVKGTAVYTANFTPATSSLTASTNTQLLTLQYDQPPNNHTFLDSSSNQFLITRSGNASQGTFSPFSQSGWSVYFDGSYDCIKVASDAAFGLGTGNFTIELWVNFDDYYAPQSRLAGQYTSGNTNGWQIYKNANSYNLIFNTNTADHISYNWSSVTTNTWYHIAVVRSGTGTNQTIMYINGVNVATGTCSHSVGANQVVVGGLDWAASYSTKGYISSFRYSNIARTIVVPTVPYSSDANTLVLTCQSNRFIELSASRSITIAETPKIQAFSPFAATAVYNPAVHGGSAYFDGTGDYLQTTISALPGQFTVEFWFYRSSTGNNFMFNIGDSINNTAAEVYIGTNGTVLNYYSNGNARITATPPNAGTWSYIAVSRDASNVVRLYLNGTQVGGTYTQAATLDTTLRVGAEYYNAAVTGTATGYISGFRVSNTARTIEVPTQPLVNDASTVCLLNFTDAAILDSTGRNVLETVADARTSSVVTKFTGGSMYFDGTGDWTIIPTSPNFGYGTGDFTIELWLYWTGSGTQTIVSNLTADASTNPHLYIGTNVLKYFTASADRITGPTLSANQWYHIAISRSTGSTRLFVNGTQSGSTYADSNNYGTTAPFALGTYWNNGTPSSASTLSGYVSDLRITRGYARYTGNFTAPTAPARLK